MDTKKLVDEQTFEESTALNKITLDLLEQKKKENFRLWIVILALILVNLVEVGLFFWYESQFEVTDTVTTETTTVDQEAEEGNNVYQAGEHAQYNEGGD